MSCYITDGIALDCMDALGGIKTAWVLGGTGATVGITSYALSATDEITGITGSGTFYKFEVPKDTAMYTETCTVAPAAGTVFYDQAISFQFHKMDTAKRNQLKLLAQNRDLKVVFLDNNGNYWMVGITRGAQITASAASTGTAPGDANNYTVTLTAQEPNPAYRFSSAFVTQGGITVE